MMIVQQLTFCVLIVSTNGHLRSELAESDKVSKAKISLDPATSDPHRRYRKNSFGEVTAPAGINGQIVIEDPPGTNERRLDDSTYADSKYACEFMKDEMDDMDDSPPCVEPYRQTISKRDNPSKMIVDYNVTMSSELKRCSDWIHPLADFDAKSGHGSPKCRYEPSQEKMAR